MSKDQKKVEFFLLLSVWNDFQKLLFYVFIVLCLCVNLCSKFFLYFPIVIIILNIWEWHYDLLPKLNNQDFKLSVELRI